MKPVIMALVTFNCLKKARECVLSVLERTDLGLCDLYVVDNGSEDGMAQWLMDVAPKHMGITYIFNSRNAGLSAAVNQVWAHRQPEQHCGWIAHDMLIGRDDWLQCMLHAFDVYPDLGYVAGWKGGSIEHYHRVGGRGRDIGNGTVLEIVSMVYGSLTLMRAPLAEQFGGLWQPGPWLVFEDIITSLRTRRLDWRQAYIAGKPPLATSLPSSATYSDEWKQLLAEEHAQFYDPSGMSGLSASVVDPWYERSGRDLYVPLPKRGTVY